MPPKSMKKTTPGPSSSRSTSKRSRQPSPPPLPWPFQSDKHQRRFSVISERPVVPTRYVDEMALDHLGLHQEVAALVGRMGWSHFITQQFPTFKEITLEMLSSLSAEFSNYLAAERVWFSFRCMGMDHRLNLESWNAIFGFPNEGARWFPGDFNPEQAWLALTGHSNYNPSVSKASHLKSPALKYIHRFMSQGLFGRGESTGVVKKPELFFLWAMVNHVKVNTGMWLLRHILQVSKCGSGKICIGGWLSIVANSFGFVPVEGIHTVIAGHDRIDLDTLVHMKLCKYMGGHQYQLLGAREPAIPTEEEAVDVDQQPPEAAMEHEDTNEAPARFPPSTGPSTSSSEYTLVHMMDKMMERFQQLETLIHTNQEANERAFARIEDKLDQFE